jgi:MYXO-CTERM domain-containing protein
VADHDPHSEQDQSGRRHERPADWGWHGEWGVWARVGGWLCVGLLILLNFTWHYNRVGSAWLWGIAALLVLLLIRDWYRRRNAWRS